MAYYDQIAERIAQSYGREITGKKEIGDFMLDATHAINVVSSNIEKENYSPNIVSAKRILEWIQDPNRKYSIIFITYKGNNDSYTIIDQSAPTLIEHVEWRCLTIEAQGWGVIQLKSSPEIDTQLTRGDFFSGLKSAWTTYVEKQRNKLVEIENLINTI